MANPKQAAEILASMKQMGLLITVDDFGTGHSSLAHLHRLPIDSIKIDKSFVMKMATETQDAVIVRSMIHLAHNLNLRVVAEGVENRQTMDMLRTMGCDMAQGYHISHLARRRNCHEGYRIGAKADSKRLRTRLNLYPKPEEH